VRNKIFLQYVSHSGPGDVMKLGYARVSTDDQTLDIQRQKLTAVGYEALFEEKISGAQRQRPELERLLAQLRKGDVLVVSRLDRLARSTAELLRISEVITEKTQGYSHLMNHGLTQLHLPGG